MRRHGTARASKAKYRKQIRALGEQVLLLELARILGRDGHWVVQCAITLGYDVSRERTSTNKLANNRASVTQQAAQAIFDESCRCSSMGMMPGDPSEGEILERAERLRGDRLPVGASKDADEWSAPEFSTMRVGRDGGFVWNF